jgi:SGNH domain (fused to AT3 domains)
MSGAGIAALAVLVLTTDGARFRLSSDQAAIADFQGYRAAELYREGSCFLRADQVVSDYSRQDCYDHVEDKRNVLLWGDSHAAHYLSGMRKLPDTHVMQANLSSCPPLLGYDAKARPQCRSFNEMVAEMIRSRPPDVLILSAAWYFMSAEEVLAHIASTVERVRRPGMRIVILGPSIAYDQQLPKLLLLGFFRGDQANDMESHIQPNLRSLDLELSRRVPQIEGVRYVSVLKAVCGNKPCPIYANPQVPMQWDTSHLTVEGSDVVAQAIADDVLRN